MSAGPLLFDFVRHWSRRSGPHTERGRLVALLGSVESANARGEGAAVGVLAEDLGIDQSGTSRLLGEARAAGLVRVQAGEADARRRVAFLEPGGAELLAEARAWQERVFRRLCEGWSEARREEFAAAMAELLEASHGLGDPRGVQ